MIRAARIQIGHQFRPMGISPTGLRVDWVCEGAGLQSAFRLTLRHGGRLLYDSGKRQTREMCCAGLPPMPFAARIRVEVRLWDENDAAGAPAESDFETGPDLTRLSAQWIDPEPEVDPDARKPASYLKKTFFLEKTGRGRIYATAHGIFDVYLNGIHLDSELLMPGTSRYENRLTVRTLDCTQALRAGENVLAVTLGDGWYRGGVGHGLNFNTFGRDVALLLQLEVAGEAVCATDGSWLASQSGPLRENDIKLGECYDARRERITDWHPVSLPAFSMDNLIYPESVPVRRQERFSPRKRTTPAGETVLDFGVNLAGFVEFSLEARAGQEIVLTHGETLDGHGNFTVDNFRNAEKPEFEYQKIRYICKDGSNTYSPTKTYFGFRYVKVEAAFDIDPACFTAVSVYSDMPRTGWFTCGDRQVNTLFENALRSMKGNFVDIPTDCPTREKAGWSGDAQIFAHTAAYLMDCYDIYAKWLRELAAEQYPDGKLPSVAPRRGNGDPRDVMTDGSVGWGDAITVIPTVLLARYGDGGIGDECYDAMKKWVEHLLTLARESREANKALVPEPLWPYFIDRGFLWGEWLEPGMNVGAFMAHMLQNGEPEVSTAYLCYSSRLLSRFAARLGKAEDAAFYADVSEKARQAYRALATRDGAVTGNRQCRYVRPIALGLLDGDEAQRAADALAAAVRRNGNRLNTGFLSTHSLCRVLTDHGHAETAYDLLLQTQCPGWLYAVEHGATSVWETWDGVREDGTVHDSMNHYSYGAVVGWLFDSVCGIRLENGEITVCPHPDRRLGHAEAVYDSPLGRIVSAWAYEGERIHYRVELPGNTQGTLLLPGREAMILGPGRHTF